MGGRRDGNYIPVWQWMLMLLVVAIPCIGFIMIIVWAFIDENETRKNYFRAMIIWFLLFVLVWGGLMMLGVAGASWPTIQKYFHQWTLKR